MRVSWLQRGLPMVALALLVVVAYGGSLSNSYVWDDRYFLLDFAWLETFSSAVQTAFSPLFQAEAYVRPIPLLSLYVEGLLGGRNPAVSHAVNLLIHFASTALVYLLATDAMGPRPREFAIRWMALLLAAFFAVHPALSEAVVWVSSRFDLLATFFVLMGLWVATRDGWHDWKVAVGVGVCFLLALLCKESAVVFPAMLGILRVLKASAAGPVVMPWRAINQARWMKVLVAGMAFGLAYLAIRYAVLGGFGLGSGEGAERPAQELFARVMVALPKYLQLTLLPFIGNSPQHTFVWTLESSVFDFIVPIVTSLALVLGVLMLVARRQVAGWVLLAWIVCYLPVIHLLPINIGNNSIQQRFMYLPTAVLLAFLPYVLTGVSLSVAARRLAPFLAGILLVACVLVTRSIVPAWRSELSLWTWADQTAPRSSLVRENLIWAYLDLGLYEKVDEEAERLGRDGIQTTINALVNVGASWHRRGEFEKAIYYYEYALQHAGPEDADKMSALYVNIAVSYAMLGRDLEARDMLLAGYRANLRSHTAIGNLLAFCDGREVDTGAFGALELQRAQSVRTNMVALLRERRGAAGWSALCPEGAVEPELRDAAPSR